MKHAKLVTFGFLVIVISALLCCSGCIRQQEEEPVEYVEIREYEGEQLSSIDDFRENSIKGPQQIDKESYVLEITGLVENPQTYSYDEIVDGFQTHKRVVRLDCVEGWSVTIFWEGVLVRDVLKEANVSSDATVVIFHAYDGYTTSLPLEYILENDIIMAYRMNNVTLPPERGFPFQLVAESKWGYKWIKWITEIELSDDTGYRGYWERRGYSNTADLNESFVGR
jgi:DMSO/TMAO reductase YedYZ molybdopterin-dependent catalytic subunit